MPYVARHTNLHPRLWRAYKIIPYPAGFLSREGQPDFPPVWEAYAMVIDERGHACHRLLDMDCASLDAALDACWAHYGSIH